MAGLVKRNLRLYFGNRSGVFFSLLGALIAFALYLVFLKDNMAASWGPVPGKSALLDTWLIGGTLATTAITTTANAVSTAVSDRENGQLVDLMLTEVSSRTIQAAYAVSGIVVGTGMQLVMGVGLAGYFWLTDGVRVAWAVVPQMVAVAVLNATLWTGFNLVIQSFIRRMGTLSLVQSLLGTAAGFFVGVYLPIGMLPLGAQHVMKWTPAPYSASVYRRLLMAEPLAQAFGNGRGRAAFERHMGVGIDAGPHASWMTDTMVLCLGTVVFTALAVLVAKRSQQAAVQPH